MGVAEGALGVFLHAEANFSHDKATAIPPHDWRAPLDQPAEACMTGMGIHMTDLLIDMFGPVKEVDARMLRFNPDGETGAVIATTLNFVAGGWRT